MKARADVPVAAAGEVVLAGVVAAAVTVLAGVVGDVPALVVGLAGVVEVGPVTGVVVATT